MLAVLLALSLGAVQVEGVVAVVNGVPVLVSDVEMARIAELVPRGEGEDTAAWDEAIADALIELELRWQDLRSASLTDRIAVDVDAAWRRAAARVGGEEVLRRRLAEAGLGEETLRSLLRRAAIVQAYVQRRFEPFVHPGEAEVRTAWEKRFLPELRAAGKPVPELEAVRTTIEAVLREEKLLAEVQRWTDDLARRAEIVRYRR